jgi:hypothetical protein
MSVYVPVSSLDEAKVWQQSDPAEIGSFTFVAFYRNTQYSVVLVRQIKSKGWSGNSSHPTKKIIIKKYTKIRKLMGSECDGS